MRLKWEGLLDTESRISIPLILKGNAATVSKLKTEVKRDKIKRYTMMADKNEGGLSMPEFSLKVKALKVAMLQRICQEGNEKWKILPLYYINKYGGKQLVLKMNFLNERKIPVEISIPEFYKQLIISWYSCVSNNKESPKDSTDIRKEIIWGNQWILHDGKQI